MAWGSVNVPGGSTQGADGKSAYEIAVQNGYTGSVTDWLASLKGAKGDKGDPGAVGPAGPGLPAGGTVGQIPVKKSANDHDTEWKTLKPSDIGAAVTDHAHRDYLPKVTPTFDGKLKYESKDRAPTIDLSKTGDSYGIVLTEGGYSDRLGGVVLGDSAAYHTDSIITLRHPTVSGDNVTYDVQTNSTKLYDYLDTVELPNTTLYGLTTVAADSPRIRFKVAAYSRTDKTVTFSSSYGYTVLPPADIAQGFDRAEDSVYIIMEYSSPTGASNGMGNAGRLAIGHCNYTVSGTLNSAGCIGDYNFSHGSGSFAIGTHLVATSVGDFDTYIALGQYNILPTFATRKSIVTVGCGSKSARANAFRITDTGVYAKGNYNASGADYAEMFEWADGNPNSENRAGRFVTLDGANIRLAAEETDFILGVVSGDPSIVGDVYDDQWQGMFVTDIFGRPVMEEVTVPAEYDNEGNLISDEHTETRQKLNPDYKPSQSYTPRSQRPEWDAVGMLGKLVLIDDGTCEVNGWAKPTTGGIGTKSETQTKFRVMERLDETHVRVLIL